MIDIIMAYIAPSIFLGHILHARTRIGVIFKLASVVIIILSNKQKTLGFIPSMSLNPVTRTIIAQPASIQKIVEKMKIFLNFVCVKKRLQASIPHISATVIIDQMVPMKLVGKWRWFVQKQNIALVGDGAERKIRMNSKGTNISLRFMWFANFFN